MTNPQISVVTPSYNQADFIEETILSVKAQGYDDVEHIVVDGGSTDGTIDILRKHEDDYDLRWVSEEDRGQTHAINKGIEMAKGEWIGWLNSDDKYLPGAFRALKIGVCANPSVDVVYGDLLFVDEEGAPFRKRYHTRPSKFIHRYWTLFTANHCTFFHETVFETVGKLDEELEFAMDVDLFSRMLDADLNYYHVPEFIGARRMHEEAKTSKHSVATQREKRDIYVGDRKHVPDLLLTGIAMAVKASYMLADGLSPSRPESLRWSIESVAYELSRPFR